MVRTPSSHSRPPKFNPWSPGWRTGIPQATWPKKQNKTKTEPPFYLTSAIGNLTATSETQIYDQFIHLNTLATACEELTHWKRPWCWEGLGAGGEGDDRGWDGWMASPTQWTWVWVNSGSWWWSGRPGVLWFMGSQRVGHHWTTELNWTECYILSFIFSCTAFITFF